MTHKIFNIIINRLSVHILIKNIEDFAEQRINLDEIPSLLHELKNICERAFIELKKELEKISG
ncbi:MAG: hypothetical protein A2068_01905 [Ignavibacteria bacterium GWB2_35_6b]|nr:MAG: hypothetical protein A2068_01905 [Ignavibacteria bacterium GWB2_35_6b]